MAKENPVALKLNQRANFKELRVGAGESQFSALSGWVWGGGSTPTNAKFTIDLTTGALVTEGTINAIAGSITGDLLVGTSTGSSVLIKGTTGVLNLQYNGVAKGTISGYINASHSEDSYVRLSATSGRTLTLMESMIECGGNFNPATDFGSSLGAYNLRWNDVYAKSIIAHGTGAKFSINGSDGQDGSLQFITQLQWDGSTLEKKAITLGWTKGILTNVGEESGWEEV